MTKDLANKLSLEEKVALHEIFSAVSLERLLTDRKNNSVSFMVKYDSKSTTIMTDNIKAQLLKKISDQELQQYYNMTWRFNHRHIQPDREEVALKDRYIITKDLSKSQFERALEAMKITLLDYEGEHKSKNTHRLETLENLKSAVNTINTETSKNKDYPKGLEDLAKLIVTAYEEVSKQHLTQQKFFSKIVGTQSHLAKGLENVINLCFPKYKVQPTNNNTHSR